MPWIQTRPPSDPEVGAAMAEAIKFYPDDYRPENRHKRQVPEAVAKDNIVLAHSLLPEVLKHSMAAYGAMLSPDLPLSRRQHEMIAATVSVLNACFY